MTLTTNITLSETATRRAGPVPELPELPPEAMEMMKPIVRVLEVYTDRQVAFPEITDTQEAMLDQLVESGMLVQHDRSLREDERMVSRRSWSLTPLGIAVALQAYIDGKLARGDI